MTDTPADLARIHSNLDAAGARGSGHVPPRVFSPEMERERNAKMRKIIADHDAAQAQARLTDPSNPGFSADNIKHWRVIGLFIGIVTVVVAVVIATAWGIAKIAGALH